MKNKRGQVTLFIIIGIIIVVTALSIFMFKPKITSSTRFDAQNPYAYIDTCIEDKITSTIETIVKQGGDIEPDSFIVYESEKLNYLCYTNEYYQPCVNQQPLLESHIENQIHSEVKDTLNSCFDSLKENYEKRGYTTDLVKGLFTVEILPEKIVFNLTNYEITITKQDTETYDSFDTSIRNNLYTILSIVNNIIKEEIAIGDAEIIPYMDSFRDFKLEKDQLFDGTTIYILTEIKTQTKFQFASRSQVLSSDPTIRR